MERCRSLLSRRGFVAGAAGAGLLVGCGRLPWQAPPRAKVAHIGYLIPGWAPLPSEPVHPNVEAFRQGLRDLGYVEGQNLLIEYRWAEGQADRYPALAAELVSLPVEVIVAGGGPAALQAARQATQTIPLVMVGASSDPVGQGLIASFAHPGGNVTGLVPDPGRLVTKRLELLKELVPGLSRVAMVEDASFGQVGSPTSRVAAEAAPVLGLELQVLTVRGPADFESAFQAAAQDQAGAMHFTGTPLIGTHARQIAELALAYRQPTASLWERFAADGGLLSYGPKQTGMWRYVATYVDKILKGAQPADLPVEQPREFDFVINRRTAQALGITFSQEIMLQVTEIIQ